MSELTQGMRQGYLSGHIVAGIIGLLAVLFLSGFSGWDRVFIAAYCLGTGGLSVIGLRMDREIRRRATSANGCAHPKEKLENKGWATICDPEKGGCGVKIR